MSTLKRRCTARSIVAALLTAFLFSVTAPRAAAADGPQNTDKLTGRDTSLAGETAAASAETKSPRVLYAAFEDAMSASVEPTPEPASRPRRVAQLVDSINAVTAPPMPLPPTRQPTVVSTAPMSVGEKFEYWFSKRFLSVGEYGTAIFNGMWKELHDDDDFKKDTVGNYFADSMTRAARSFAFGATSGFYEKAVLPSLFRQDPRYHRSGKTGTGAKIGYAMTRVFVTQGDRCACNQFNASFLLGAAGAAVTANLWERRERTGPFHTISRFYTHVYVTALYNVVREFVGGQ